MKHFSIIAMIILAIIITTPAQEKEEYSKWEFYGGYSSLRTEKASVVGDQSTQGVGQNTEQRGFEFSVTRNLNRYLGLKFDYSRNSRAEQLSLPGLGGVPVDLTTTFNSNLYAGGVQFKDNAAKSKIKPFAHVLFGGMTSRTETRQLNCPPGQAVCSGTEKGNGFAMVFGGGVDVKINQRISIRPIQVDYIRLNKAVPYVIEKNNVRFGAGIVFHADQAEVQTKSSSQNFPKYEIHAGYTYHKFKDVETIKLKGLQGYNASIKWNFQRFLGAEFEQSSGWGGTESFAFPGGNLDTKRVLHTYTGGIQVKDNAAKTRIKPFGHALFGAATAITKASVTSNGVNQRLTASNSDFMMIFGGGLDIKINDRLSLRPFQFDYLHPRNRTPGNGNLDNSYRFGAGIVFN
jgi:hypothetical protein